MIIATAGHVDHGKTRLVKALTGVDTDRLPEEKRRGLSIDLGFAYRTLPGGATLGFVDVPGHERFLHTMVAGVAAVDFVVLVVAADDGVMPQTREHLAIIDLLGIRCGAVALTKTDRVDAARVAECRAVIEKLLRPTTLAEAAIQPVSAETGEGIAALAETLGRAARDLPARAADGRFRLTVDRAFVLPGLGLIATGAALSGRIEAGQPLVLSPSGAAVRVRAIHAQNRAAAQGTAGDRLGLQLAGIERAQIARGDWLLDPALHAPTRRIDGRIRLLPNESRGMRKGATVHVHLGAADILGRIVPLDAETLAPGASALVQIVLDRSASALYGDRFVLRDSSAQRTIGGGVVIDPFPPARGRRRPARHATLRILEQRDINDVLRALLAQTPTGLALAPFAAARNLSADTLERLLDEAGAIAIGTAPDVVAFASAHWLALKEAFLVALGAAHAKNPDRAGEHPGLLLPQRMPDARPKAVNALARELAQEGRIAREGPLVRLSHHRAEGAGTSASAWRTIAPLLEADPPPTLSELSKRADLSSSDAERALLAALAQGLVVRIAKARFLTAPAFRRLATVAEALAGERPEGFGVAHYCERARIGRNLAIEVLEHLDRIGFTRRRGNLRVLLKPAADLIGASPVRGALGPAPSSPTIGHGGESSPVGRPDFKPGEGR